MLKFGAFFFYKKQKMRVTIAIFKMVVSAFCKNNVEAFVVFARTNPL